MGSSTRPDARPPARVVAAAAGIAALFGGGFAYGLGLAPGGSSDHAARAPAPAFPAPAPTANAALRTPIAPTAASGVDAARFRPLYRQAGRRFGVNWMLIASIHAQETAFSSAPDTYHGLNFAHCCAGPMQFNVKNGKPSTWQRFRSAYRQGSRPAEYPHRTTHHPSVYDDFDAIMAAAKLLHANGAGQDLDGAAWSAAYQYYGPGDVAAVDYANQVLARATIWQRSGFDTDAVLDLALVQSFEEAYGAPIRTQLEAAAAAAERERRAEERRRRREEKQTAEEAKQREHRAHHESQPRPEPKPHKPEPKRPPRHHSAPEPQTDDEPAPKPEGDAPSVAAP